MYVSMWFVRKGKKFGKSMELLILQHQQTFIFQVNTFKEVNLVGDRSAGVLVGSRCTLNSTVYKVDM